MEASTRGMLLAMRPAILWDGDVELRAGISWLTFCFRGQRHRMHDLSKIRRALAGLPVGSHHSCTLYGLQVDRAGGGAFRVSKNGESAMLTSPQLDALLDWLRLVEGGARIEPDHVRVLRAKPAEDGVRLTIDRITIVLDRPQADSLIDAVLRTIATGQSSDTLPLPGGLGLFCWPDASTGEVRVVLTQRGIIVAAAHRGRVDLLAFAARIALARDECLCAQEAP